MDEGEDFKDRGKILLDMKKDAIVCMNWVPLTTVMAETIDLNGLESAGYRVVYADLAGYYFTDKAKGYRSSNSLYITDVRNTVVCRTRDDILSLIEGNADRAWFFVAYRTYNFHLKDIFILRAFKRLGVEYFMVDDAPVKRPSDAVSSSRNLLFYLGKNLLKGLAVFSPRSIFHMLSSWAVLILIKRGIWLKRPAFFFTAGSVSMKKASLVFPSSSVKAIPAKDMERSLKAMSRVDRGHVSLPQYPYIVYLDQGIHDSPDAKLLGYSTVDANIFFKKMNSFFERIESATGMKVIVAASPKCRYRGDEYGKRGIFYGLTAELVYRSQMVIAHSTTAMNFALIMKKPLVLIFLKEFSLFVKEAMGCWSSALEKPLLDVDHGIDLKRLKGLSELKEKVCERYIRDYIMSGVFIPRASRVISETLKGV
ncbi:MAG: hypothetical protein HY880_02820 [Deltaproteobacteria bacterium]|nr:hypothetical protein [Deltaproteobacteria bacterium]